MANRIDQLKAILAAEPDDSFCLYGLGMEYAKLGRHDEAREWFDRTIAADPKHCYAYFQKARSQIAAGDTRSAEATLRTGIEMARSIGDMKAMNELGALLEETQSQ